MRVEPAKARPPQEQTFRALCRLRQRGHGLLLSLGMALIATVEYERNILTSLRIAPEAEGFEVETYQNPGIALRKLLFLPPIPGSIELIHRK